MAYNPLSEAEKTFILHGVQVRHKLNCNHCKYSRFLYFRMILDPTDVHDEISDQSSSRQM